MTTEATAIEFYRNLPPGTRSDDHQRVGELLEAIAPSHSMYVLSIDREPLTKITFSTVVRGRTLTHAASLDERRELAERFRRVTPFKSNVAVVCLFYRRHGQRVDVDNLLKQVLDAATDAGVWSDDSQVTAVIGLLEKDRNFPRTVVAFGEHQSTLVRGDAARLACASCGSMFYPAGTRREKARWCSSKCRVTLAEPVPCPFCKEPFKRRTMGQKYCSVPCRSAEISRLASIARRARRRCGKGHKLTTANTYMLGRLRRCRACQAALARTYRQRRDALRVKP